jgi:hypothetical protein
MSGDAPAVSKVFRPARHAAETPAADFMNVLLVLCMVDLQDEKVRK